MNIKVSDSFKRLMSRVDCKIIINEAWLGETDQDFTPNKNSLIQIPANGIWEEENSTLKVLVIIPDEHIINNNDQRQEYGAIYFFSSINSDEPAFILYNLDEPLSLGRNLINIEFSGIKARIKMTDTSEDTIFLETFGQNPGKNIYLTGNENSLVSKNTYYVFWRIETTDDDTTDLPILDKNGKLITENYTYKTYSNLRISCPGLTRTSTPPARFGLSDDGGVVPITGIADFIEYKVFGGVITETIQGEITIEDIPGSEIVYISGHNDLGQPVSEAFNIFTPNNYTSMIEYKKNDYPGSYGADGIFGLRISYYDVKEQKPVILDSVNQIKLVRRDVADNWFILDRSSRFIEDTDEFGEVPVFMFPYDTSGSEYLIIRTKFLDPITDLNQISVTQENDILNDLFRVDLSLSPYTDENGTYYVDIYVRLSALTTNNDPVNWAPIVNNISTLFYTKISYEDYFSVFYLIQKPNIEGSLKLVDQSGNRVNQIRMNNTETSKSYYVVCDAEEAPGTDFDNRPAWKVIESPVGLSFDSDSGFLSPETRASYLPENRFTVNYTTTSPTAQNIYLTDIKLARIKESGISEDLMTTRNWRSLVDIAQINVGFMKYGRNIEFTTFPVSLSTSGIGLYMLSIQSNCRFTLSTSDSGIFFRIPGRTSYSTTLDSPSYNDPRYESGDDFRYWVQVHVVTETAPSSRGPISIVATEEDRTVSRDIDINQGLVSDIIYKIKPDGTPYSSGSWGHTTNRIPHNQQEWIKRFAREGNRALEVLNFNTSTAYSPGDIVKYSLASGLAPDWNRTHAYSNGDVIQYQGDWWKSIYTGSNLGNEPTFNSQWWSCITKYFVCVRQFTSEILSDPRTYPLEYDSVNNTYAVHTTYWQEIATVDDFSNLENRVTSVHTAPMYDPTREYRCGDIVRYGVALGNAFDVNAHYTIGTVVKLGTGDPYECYRCVGYNNSGYLTGITPGSSENWQLYWEFDDPYQGFICNKDSLGNLPIMTGTQYWDPIPEDFIDLPRIKRYIGIKSKKLVYLYTNLDFSINGQLNPEDIIDEVRNTTGNEQVEDIRFILNNPRILRTGLSLRFFRPISIDTLNNTTNQVIISQSNLVSNQDVYFYIERDNTFVELDNIDTLIDIFGNQFGDPYFTTPGRQLISSDYQNRIKYSDLIAPGNRRVVYAIQNYIADNSLDNIVLQTEKLGISYLFPYYSSYSDLPGLHYIVKDTNNNFFKVINRISDGGKIRAAIIRPQLSNQFRPIYPDDPNDPITPGLTYKGEWDSNSTYRTMDIVCYSNLGRSRVYYYCLHNAVTGVNPSTDTTGDWLCITWTALPGIILTDEDAINLVIGPSYLNLNSTYYVRVRGRFSTGTTLFDATQQITTSEPTIGDIIKIGTTYYYSSLWTVIDVPTTQDEVVSQITTLDPANEPFSFVSSKNILCKGFSNVLVRRDGIFYYLDSKYVFNNIGSNRYVFIPEYSMDYTTVKYCTRKTPTEELQLVPQGRTTIVNNTTPEFDEDLVESDYYLDHFTGLGMNPITPSSSYIPQVQADYEGKLILTNPVNQNSASSLFNIPDFISQNSATIDFSRLNYHLFKEPYAPFIRLYKNNREITTINLENFYDPINISSCTTKIDIVSPHPVSILSGISGISMVSNFRYIKNNPRVERDGLYHYKLSIYPTANNNSLGATPIKLGDLYFTSQIRKNGSKPLEWVIVEDSETGIEILKRLLRTDDIEIFDIDSDISGEVGIRLASLPSFEEAIPGLVYRGRPSAIVSNFINESTIGLDEVNIGDLEAISTRLFVAIPYDFVKDDNISNEEKYYYSQEEINNIYGIYIRRVSIIQKSSYEFEITGDKTTDIDFTGETRNYNLVVTGTSWNGSYIVGSEENCMITNNTALREITMTVPSRIAGYTPKLISDTYYTELQNQLPVSFDVLINSVARGTLDSAGQTMTLVPGSSVSSTYREIEESPRIQNTYYKDDYSGVGMFLRIIETYKYYDRNLVEKSRYSYQKTSWEYITSSNITAYINEHNNKYQDNVDTTTLYGLAGIDVNVSDRTSSSLHNNIDDILGFGYYRTATPGTNDHKIKVDSLPKLAQFGTYYTTDNISFKKFCPCNEDRVTYSNYCDKYYVGTPELTTVDSIERALVDLNIATEFTWELDNRLVFLTPGYNTTPINTILPVASSRNFGTVMWYWRKSSPYNSSITYNVGDRVLENSKLWECKENGVSGITPTGSTEWEEITDTFNTSYLSLPNEIGNGGEILTDYFMILGYCYKATRVVCNIKPIYGLVSITNPNTSVGITTINNPGYDYYKIPRFPADITTWRELTGSIYIVNENSAEYARKAVPSYDGSTLINTYNYYRKQILIPSSEIYNSTTSEVYVGKIFEVFYNGSYKYFQLKKNPEELLIPNDYSGSTDSSYIGYLGNSEYPGNLMLAKDGYGKASSTIDLFIDFNDFSYKVQSFEEKIDLRQKRATRGIISNLGESTSDQYRLYFGDFPDKNTITIAVRPEDTEVSGMIGLFSTTSELTSDSNISGVFPSFNIISSPGCNVISNQTLPRLDGGQTENLIITFDPNIGDQDLIHDFEFYTSEDGFNTRVFLRIIQLSDPGEVTILGSSDLYFLSNGLLQNPRNSGGFLDFNSTLDINLNNIEILNDQGEDILDRGDEDNPVSYVNPISITNGSVRYRAFLKLKPNTTNHAYTGFRIKIGKISGNTVTDRTIIGDGRFYKYTESGWTMLGSEYTPSWLEKYVTSLPSFGNLGEIVCVCTSLRGSQGYYSVALYNPQKTSDFDNATGLEIRRAETGDEISDLRSALGIDEGVNLDTLATVVSELPERIKQSGLIYKIGNAYYYSYADYITSDYTLGSPQVPIIIGSSSVDEQKFHLKVTQLEYDTVGYATTTNLTNTIFISGQNYRLSNDQSEFFSGIVENEDNRIYTGYYNSQIIYSSTSIPDFVPYLSTRYEFSEQSDIASIITIKAIIDLELNYNYSGPVIPESYRKIKNRFTLYIRKN